MEVSTILWIILGLSVGGVLLNVFFRLRSSFGCDHDWVRIGVIQQTPKDKEKHPKLFSLRICDKCQKTEVMKATPSEKAAFVTNQRKAASRQEAVNILLNAEKGHFVETKTPGNEPGA